MEKHVHINMKNLYGKGFLTIFAGFVFTVMSLQGNAFNLPGSALHSRLDTFPNYSLSNFVMVFPFHIGEGYNYDDAYLVCDSLFSYEVTGSIPPQGADWIIKTNTGNQNCQTVNTPYGALCRLLYAYQSGNLNNIIGQYHPDDTAAVREIYTDTAVYPYFMGVIDSIEGFKVKIGLSYGDYFIVNTDILYPSYDSAKTAYYLRQYNGAWYFASLTDSLVKNYNIAAFVKFNDAWQALGTNDQDGDGIINSLDNCPCASNPGQEDNDNDGRGNVCDNCINKPNPDQTDSDGDGFGDDCDNCILWPNPFQENSDGDMMGDSCDNCPYVSNPNQRDLDEDQAGDACDDDMDNDGLPNNLDDDIDGDGILNTLDNCPLTANGAQEDFDGDNVGDYCDNCTQKPNADQADMDNDGLGDVCDSDKDGDGVLNVYDNCPNIFNPDQQDTDCDGIGDVCE